jgi:hypothetical protein
MARTWITPELLTLESGAEAAAGKHQPISEGVGDSCEPGTGCPGDEEDIDGPS